MLIQPYSFILSPFYFSSVLRIKSSLNDTLGIWFIETVWNRWIHTPNPTASRLSHTLDYMYMPPWAVYFYFLECHMLLNITKSVLWTETHRNSRYFCMLVLIYDMRLRYIFVCLFSRHDSFEVCPWTSSCGPG